MCWQSCETHLTHAPGHTHTFANTRRNTQTHGVILLLSLLESMSVQTLVFAPSRSLVPSISCVSLFKRKAEKSKEKTQNVRVRVCVCVHNTSCVTTWRSLDPPELSSWVWEGCHHIPEAGRINTCSECECVMYVRQWASRCNSSWILHFQHLWDVRNLQWIGQARLSSWWNHRKQLCPLSLDSTEN